MTGGEQKEQNKKREQTHQPHPTPPYGSEQGLEEVKEALVQRYETFLSVGG